ncbi:MAG TPA: hypothetical protein VL572_09600 [Pyrinomonadaceae bacterium]|nr:hypothetical protein [Pyrinomonadaceae bacterium]
MIQTNTTAGKPDPFKTIVLGGLTVGVLDFLDASIFFPLYYGITFQRVWHGVAAGIYGRDAAPEGGWNTALLGIFLHFIVAFGVATVYYVASRNISFLIRHPVISGLIYGIIVNFVMQWVVIPLSAIGWRSGSEPLGSMLNSIVGHALLVGLPVALIAAWSAGRRSDASH